jgi:hypothetical protein
VEPEAQKPAFCETKPNVICVNYAVSRCNGVGCVDYRKMTNGFVLAKNGNRDDSELAALPSISERAGRAQYLERGRGVR